MYPKLLSTSLLLQLTFACGDSPPSENPSSVDGTESETTEATDTDDGITQSNKPFYLLPRCQSKHLQSRLVQRKLLSQTKRRSQENGLSHRRLKGI